MSTIFVPDDFYCPITGELMSDPVSDPDGHTYERSAIEKWLSKKNSSPMTRQYLTIENLKENKSLKKSIDSIREKISEEQIKIKSKLLEKDLVEFNRKMDGITIKASTSLDNTLFVNFDVPNAETRQPVDIVLCLDISGSMGTDAPVKGDDGSSTSYGISVLSLTVSAAKTILKTLNENDNISIVTYSCSADIMFTDTACTPQNKATIETELDNLKPTGTTNMWDGIVKSLDCLRQNSPPDKLKVIKLFTDGLPSSEPSRGYESALQKYFKDNNFKCMINCYGFGYSLKSEILNNISYISGGDGYAFIPDSSLLSNIFIHGISNFFTTAATDSKVTINYVDKTSETITVNTLKYGQKKNVVKQISKDVSDVDVEINGQKYNIKLEDISDEHYQEQMCRYETCNALDDCITMKKFNDEGFKTTLDNLILKFNFNPVSKDNEYIQNILFDLEGQVKESLNMTSQGQKEDWFTRWGIHYLRSLVTAYKNEVCNNFKDRGVSNFTGELFEKLRDEISDIFDNMPPPKRTERTTYGSSGMRGGFQFPGGGGVQPLQPLATMASYNMASGGCCARGSMVKMDDGSIKAVEDIKKGDEVVTINIKNGIEYIESGKIEAVIVTECHGGFQNMVTLNGIGSNKLHITPYHPVIEPKSREWVYPISISKKSMIKCPEMYTFVISNRGSILVEDYVFATYGHGLMDNQVIQHDYFGTNLVINDLMNYESYNLGKVYLTEDMFVRNDNGDVCKIGLEFKYYDFVNMIYNSKL
mgnify:CR=1 FL=1